MYEVFKVMAGSGKLIPAVTFVMKKQGSI